MGFYGVAERRPMGRGERLAMIVVAPLAALLTLIIIVFFVLYDTGEVDGQSMYPTLLDGDLMLVQPDYDSPLRGDIVLIDASDYRSDVESFVKRVIALPGDEVRVVGGVAFVNGIEETYDTIGYGSPDHPGANIGPITVPTGSVFVMGDNRPISLDSRFIGPVAITDIRGRVDWIFAPITRIRRIDSSNTGT